MSCKYVLAFTGCAHGIGSEAGTHQTLVVISVSNKFNNNKDHKIQSNSKWYSVSFLSPYCMIYKIYVCNNQTS